MKHTFRIICLILLLLNTKLSKAQLKITTTTFNGVTYKVYPVRIVTNNPEWLHKQQKWETNDEGIGELENRQSNVHGEEFLPFVPFELDDGHYLAYYVKQYSKWDKKLHEPIYLKDDTTKVAVIFEIKNNQKHGSATWYGYLDGAVIQTGNYTNGKKSGKWTLNRGEYRAEYQYVDDLLNGPIFRYRKNMLLSEQNMMNGQKNGLHKTYHTNGTLDDEVTYLNGDRLISKSYWDNGLLQFYENHSARLLPGDTLQKYYFYKSKSLSSVSILDSDTTLEQYKSFYFNGQIQKEELRFRGNTYLENSPDPSPFSELAHFMGLSRYTIHHKEYHSNGVLKTAFDFNQFTKDSSIRKYDEKGKLLQEGSVFPMPSDTTHIWFKVVSSRVYLKEFSEYGYRHSRRRGHSKWYHRRIHLRKYTHPYKNDVEHVVIGKRKDDDMSLVITDKKGKITAEHKSEFLDYYFADSIGVAFQKQEIDGLIKKTITTTYSILHQNQSITTIQIGKKMYQDFAVFPYGEKEDKQLMIRINEYSKKHDFVVEHKKVIDAPLFIHTGGGYASVFKFDRFCYPDVTMDYQIRYKGELYSGEVERNWKRRLNYPYQTKLDKHWVKNLHKYVEPTLVVFMKSRYKSKADANFLNGEISVLKLSYMEKEVEYEDNKMNGEFVSHNGLYSVNYNQGIKHGLERSEEGSKSYFMNKFHGEYVKYECYSPDGILDYQPSVRIHFNMDTMQGWYLKYADAQIVKEQVFMDRGIPHGAYWKGNVIAPTSIKATLNQGFLVDTAFYYFSEGILKVSCVHQLSDSEFYAGRMVRDYGFRYAHDRSEPKSNFDIGYRRLIGDPEGNRLYRSSSIITFDANRTGDYTYYYKNGVMAQRGRVEDGFRVGIWEFWDLNGGKMKTIKYEIDQYISPKTGDTIEYFGKIEMWYPNGKPLLTGLVLSEFTQFKCDQEMEVNFENVYYLTQFDEAGNQMLEDNSGQVYEYHNNGIKRLEGNIKNGKREGEWRFYDPDGRLEKVGSYVNGLKEGLWVRGDLEAVPHYYNRCMPGEVSPYTIPPINQVGFVQNAINITETVFVRDELITSSKSTLLPLYGKYHLDDYRFGDSHADF